MPLTWRLFTQSSQLALHIGARKLCVRIETVVARKDSPYSLPGVYCYCFYGFWKIPPIIGIGVSTENGRSFLEEEIVIIGAHWRGLGFKSWAALDFEQKGVERLQSASLELIKLDKLLHYMFASMMCRP
jgi:hypothetical protein